MECRVYLLALLSILTLQCASTVYADHNCDKCTINAECNNQQVCVCKENFTGDPLFHCFSADTDFCRMCNDPGLQDFSGERVVVKTVGSSLMAALTTERHALYDGQCYINLYEWTERVKGKIYVKGIQFDLHYQDSHGQIYSHEARITAIVDIPDCSKIFADIIFVIDSSGSIGSDNYDFKRNFVSNFTQNFEIGPDNVQFGLIVFSATVEVLFHLNTHSDSASLTAAIDSAPYLGSVTRTDLALAKILDDNLFSAANGGRDGAVKLVVVMTDGLSSRANLTTHQANRLKASGVVVIAIGVGNADQAELERIASSASDVFHVENFNVLENIEIDVIQRTCEDTCEGFYKWDIEVKDEGKQNFRHVQTIAEVGSPSNSKYTIDKFFCVIEFKRIDAKFLRVDFQCCGVQMAIRAHNPCEDGLKPGIWIVVDKANNPAYFWPFTVPLCLDDGTFTIDNVINGTGLSNPQFAYSFLSLINGGPVDYPGAPQRLEELRNALLACDDNQLNNFYNNAYFLLSFPPLIHCVSTVPGQDEIVYLMLRTIEYFCQSLIPGCDEVTNIINSTCSQQVINKDQDLKDFFDAPCVSQP